MSDFKRLIKEIIGKYNYESLDEMLEEYEHFVIICRDFGYNDHVEEFDFDLQVRSIIDDLLADDQLKDFPEMAVFHGEVKRIDEILKSSYIENVSRTDAGPWWSRGILKKGSGDYAKHIEEIYGIKL